MNEGDVVAERDSAAEVDGRLDIEGLPLAVEHGDAVEVAVTERDFADDTVRAALSVRETEAVFVLVARAVDVTDLVEAREPEEEGVSVGKDDSVPVGLGDEDVDALVVTLAELDADGIDVKVLVSDNLSKRVVFEARKDAVLFADEEPESVLLADDERVRVPVLIVLIVRVIVAADEPLWSIVTERDTVDEKVDSKESDACDELEGLEETEDDPLRVIFTTEGDCVKVPCGVLLAHKVDMGENVTDVTLVCEGTRDALDAVDKVPPSTLELVASLVAVDKKINVLDTLYVGVNDDTKESEGSVEVVTNGDPDSD